MGDLRWPDGRVPVMLSAHDSALIRADAAALADYLECQPELTSLAAHLARTRRIRRYRTVIRAHDTRELAAALHAVADGRDHPLAASSARSAPARIAFVYPGQGGQHPGMGADAYRGLAVYRAEVDACAAAFTAAGHPAPTRYLIDDFSTDNVSIEDDDPATFTEIEVQGAQFTHAVALSAVWRSCGVTPDLTVGHSLGEVAAAYLAETLTLADAVTVLAARAGVVDRLPGDYAVAALGITEQAARELIAETEGWLELSVINSSASVAVSGDRGAVSAAVRTIQARGQLGREITVNFPVHTSVLDPLRDGVREGLPQGGFADSPVRFIGSVTGDVVTAGTEFAEYWYDNLRRTVRFDRAVDAALACGATTFVEMSSHPALLHAIEDRIEHAGRPAGAVLLTGSGLRGQPLDQQLTANIAAVTVADPGHRWRQGSAGAPLLRNVPNAPMRATHLWAHPEPLPPRPRLTIAVETWLPTRLPVPRAVRKVAVVGVRQPLTERVAAAIGAHEFGVIAGPADADLIIHVAPATSGPDGLAAAVGDGLFDHLGSLTDSCRDIWLLTVGGECTGPADASPQPAQAALAAMHRSLAFEHPDQAFHHLDLATADISGSTVDVLLGGGGELALRQQLYRRELQDRAGHVPPAWPLAEVLDNVVITGGAGAIGMQYARYFAEHGARRIVLLSRRSADPAFLAELAHRHGTDIASPRCDITDPSQVRSVAEEFAGDGASVLIHAAGSATWDTRAQLSAAAVRDTLAAKVDGLATVTALWPLREDARIVLCSSVIGVWGGRGTAAYAAANRMLDAAAAQLRADGRRCVAVKWGLWQRSDLGGESGIVDAAETARVERTGLLPMASEAAIEAGLYDYPVDPLILDADPDRLARFLGTQQTPEPTPPRPDEVGTTGTDPADVVRTQLAAVLDVEDAQTLDLDASLFDLGIDSLLALDLRKRLTSTTGQTVPLAILLGGITAHELITTLTDAAGTEKHTEGGYLA